MAGAAMLHLGKLAFWQGSFSDAAERIQQALARWPVDQPAYDGLVAATRMALGVAGYAATYAAGHGCDWRELPAIYIGCH